MRSRHASMSFITSVEANNIPKMVSHGSRLLQEKLDFNLILVD